MLKPFNETEACFMYLLEGSFQFRTPEKVLEFNAGDALLAKCSDYFFEQNESHHRNTSRTSGVGIYLYPSIVKELFDFDLSISDFETSYDTTKVSTDVIMKNFIQGIDYLLDNPTISNDSMIKVKLKEFLLLLSNTENAPTLLDFLSSLFKPYEYDFKSIIEQNIYAGLSMVEFARLCGMSISTFQRTFQLVYEQTPAKYILEQRIIKAKKFLSKKNTLISEIAYECGFQSISTFNRLFKKSTSLSPSEFRLNEIE
ncbi:AraC family transcriptional regulator [Saprospiraceae bacterium]|nr:AraC family transcriptional regulator [Saprospiraceae bacterium]